MLAFALVLALTACGDDDDDEIDGGPSPVDGGCPSCDDGGPASSDGGPEADGARPRTDGGVRGVTNPEVIFEGTELELDRQYGLYIQDDGAIEIVDDPTGGGRQVIRYRKEKASDWAHVMIRPNDMRSDYRDPAQITEYEVAYHYRQEMYVTGDAQYDDVSFNLLEDFHCEPCEANNLQTMLNMDDDGSFCLWLAYSTDPTFDPRGPGRGGTTDPWAELSGDNRIVARIGADGYPMIAEPLPPTGALVLCRDDLRTADLFDRWVEVEIIMRPSSYDTGVVMMWVDGLPYFHDGPNIYRWNQDDAGSLPVNTFQIGLYGQGVDPAPGTSEWFELFTTPPRIEVGDGIIGR